MEQRFRQYFDALPCYLTVQDREFRLIDANETYRKDFGDWLFGCDVCQDVCPWNRKPSRQRRGSSSPFSSPMTRA